MFCILKHCIVLYFKALYCFVFYNLYNIEVFFVVFHWISNLVIVFVLYIIYKKCGVCFIHCFVLYFIVLFFYYYLNILFYYFSSDVLHTDFDTIFTRFLDSEWRLVDSYFGVRWWLKRGEMVVEGKG